MPPRTIHSKKRSGATKRSAMGPTPKMQSVQFLLHIQTTNTSPQRGPLLNRFEEPDSEIKSIRVGPLGRYDRDLNENMALTAAEKKEPGFVGDKLTLDSKRHGRDGRIVTKTRKTYKTRKGFFTIAEVAKIVEKFEAIDRPKSRWFGGIDCHHIFFEGLYPTATDGFCVCWGS